MNWKDVFVRAFKTFVQTIVPALMGFNLLSDKAAWVELLTGSVVASASAGLSVIWNALLNWSKDER